MIILYLYKGKDLISKNRYKDEKQHRLIGILTGNEEAVILKIAEVSNLLF